MNIDVWIWWWWGRERGIKRVGRIDIIIIIFDQVIGWKLIWRSTERRERAWRREW